jgi:hypothetical protein
VPVNPEELLALLGWIPQQDWQRETISRIVSDLAAVERRRRNQEVVSTSAGLAWQTDAA